MTRIHLSSLERIKNCGDCLDVRCDDCPLTKKCDALENNYDNEFRTHVQWVLHNANRLLKNVKIKELLK